MIWLSLVGNFLKKIPWQVWLLSGVMALFAISNWWSYNRGEASTQAKWDQAVERGRVLLDDLSKGQVQVTKEVETVYVDRWHTIYEKGEVIEKEIPIYIPAGSCDLPTGFRVLHDAAATGTVPIPARIPDAAPVPVRDAARTVTRNYTECQAAISDLEGLRVWVAKQRKLYLELCKQRGVDCSKGSRQE